MKSLVILLIAFLGFSSMVAQFGPPQIISTTVINPTSIPHDVDNDGFIDVVTYVSGKIVWNKNQDGQGDFGSEILISEIPGIRFNEFVDIDSDGDYDLMYFISDERKVAWLENLDGTGTFGGEQIILVDPTEELVGFVLGDIDSDGDIDILIKFRTEFYAKLSWLENLNGLGVFGPETLIVEGSFSALLGPHFVDIDNDGNLDILTSHENFGPARIVWFKNLGDGTFDDEQEIYQYDYILSDNTSIWLLKYADINTDGLMDISVMTNNDDIGLFVDWLIAIDGQGNFEEPQRLVTPTPGNYNFYDIDNDGDNDLLSFHPVTDEFFWWENVDGVGTLDIKRVITDEFDYPRGGRAADFNGDGLLDVVANFGENNTIAWFENTGILSITENPDNQFLLYPNPTLNNVTIKTQQKIESIELFNSLGESLKTIQDSKTISLNDVAAGVYFAKIIGMGGASETHKIIKL